MAKPMKTPGVYIVEKNAFPNSIVEVETSIPVFIGYTEKADFQGSSLENKPTMLTSMNQFHSYFGYGPQTKFKIAKEDSGGSANPDPNKAKQKPKATAAAAAQVAKVSYDGEIYTLTPVQEDYLLYRSMRMFFANGGSKCFVVSVGLYTNTDTKVVKANLLKGIAPLVKEQEPTMLVIPDAVLLSAVECKDVQEAMLAHCTKMANRVSILDVHNGYEDFTEPNVNVIDEFRKVTGTLKYGAAYYPWLETSVLSDRDVGIQHIQDDDGLLKALLEKNLRALLGTRDAKDAEGNTIIENGVPRQVDVYDDTVYGKLLTEVEGLKATSKQLRQLDERAQNSLVDLNNALRSSQSQVYDFLIREMKDKLNLLPPSAAMAGIYTRVDTQRGVWKAPANVGVSLAVKPAVSISHDGQETLNVHPMGKSINAIREFIGEGVMVWGARTLDGNSLDWRYISVRRTMIMLEESVRLAAKAYVFESNTANTWVTMKSMIGNFLTGIWKRGGLAGAVPEDAFSVHVGLGETMTPVDILEGILRITVLVAPTRPAEFIEITFQQQQQKS